MRRVSLPARRSCASVWPVTLRHPLTRHAPMCGTSWDFLTNTSVCPTAPLPVVTADQVVTCSCPRVAVGWSGLWVGSAAVVPGGVSAPGASCFGCDAGGRLAAAVGQTCRHDRTVTAGDHGSPHTPVRLFGGDIRLGMGRSGLGHVECDEPGERPTTVGSMDVVEHRVHTWPLRGDVTHGGRCRAPWLRSRGCQQPSLEVDRGRTLYGSSAVA
jgi:hypothetical protein